MSDKYVDNLIKSGADPILIGKLQTSPAPAPAPASAPAPKKAPVKKAAAKKAK